MDVIESDMVPPGIRGSGRIGFALERAGMVIHLGSQILERTFYASHSVIFI